MRTYITRIYTGRSRFGVYTNLWPTNRNQIDRATAGVWYLNIHAAFWAFEFYGNAKTVRDI